MTTPTSPIPFQRTPAAGFEQPFEMLQACHERVERMLRLLRRLRTHLQTVGCDEQARQAAVDVVRYFDQAAPAHHEDEERHVFPALRAAGLHGETIDRLQREHAEMRELWQHARVLLLRAAEGPWAPYTPDEEGLLEQVAAVYEWHLAAENELVFPTAASLLDAVAQASMGEEMARRRGVVSPR